MKKFNSIPVVERSQLSHPLLLREMFQPRTKYVTAELASPVLFLSIIEI